ncbi:hypothetical protein F8388_014303 [Cannabis sativa]|uniref:Pectinesterase n=1 Tax=Cannabis sativa TaxID=3483 RepID=A0A7J6HVB9_CANSA|nr:hypothetical protein G4B88_022143 [Cannabis sativa]KAF4385170.1 hypothetical protein F8388_014303 [Cannabis sativa]KAF4398749.1 hypothetical protein G4B88_028112 [Cannabis sativa]
MALKVMLFVAGVVLALQVITSSAAPSIIPADGSKLDSWIEHNIQAHEKEKDDKALDKVLATAQASSKVIKVSLDGKGDFKSITDAVKSIPAGNTARVIISIAGGVYNEHILVERTKPFVTFLGDKGNMPVITFDGTAAKFGTWNSATVSVESDYFMAANIQFVNSSPRPKGNGSGEQAVALRISGDKGAFHNCKFISFQDTLCDDKGRHIFKDCYIEGSVDFIFGDGQSLYLNTTIRSVAKESGVITAHGRDNAAEDSGFTFVHCKIIADGDTYLGRAWREMPRVIFAYTEMGNNINTSGWSDGMGSPEKNAGNSSNNDVFYGEYKCTGPGSSTSGRAKYSKILTDEEIKPFMSFTFIQGNKWVIEPPRV